MDHQPQNPNNPTSIPFFTPVEFLQQTQPPNPNNYTVNYPYFNVTEAQPQHHNPNSSCFYVMNDQSHLHQPANPNTSSSPIFIEYQPQRSTGGWRSCDQPARTRWIPKPEQMVILNAFYDDGLVNPDREETVRIRKLLDPYGPVADANVFYWFQNQRSRNRRRLREGRDSRGGAAQPRARRSGGGGGGGGGGAIQCEYEGGGSDLIYEPSYLPSPPPSFSLLGGSSSGGGGGGEIVGNHHGGVGDAFSCGGSEIQQSSGVTYVPEASDASNFHNQPPGFVTVFINGVQTEVPRGPLDMRVFGPNLVLYRSSGVPVEANEFGYSIEHLEHGENYFLISRPM